MKNKIMKRPMICLVVFSLSLLVFSAVKPVVSDTDLQIGPEIDLQGNPDIIPLFTIVYVVNESVYGPAAGGEEIFWLDNGNIINCSMYHTEFIGGGWEKIENASDYILNFTTGYINGSALGGLDPGAYLFSYYNYTRDDIPLIANVTDTPDPQEYAGYINVTTDVTDDVSVSSVWVNITGIGNSSMNQGVGDEWYHNTTYSNTPGTYNYFILANDTSDNWNQSATYTLTIQDTTLPEIANVTDAPDPQEICFYVNITADITDNVAVSSVWVNVTYPDTSTQNSSMAQGPVNQWYYNTTYNALDNHSYIIYANDTSDNWNSSTGHNFTIQDTTLPDIANVTDAPDPQEFAGLVNITVDITDNVAVSSVWVNITYPNATYSNQSMNQGAGDEWYYNASYSLLGIINYTILANDTSDNWNSSTGHNFTIQDTTLPELSNPLATPDIQIIRRYVNFTVDVVDNVAVSSVWANITYPNATHSNRSMNRGSGDEWYLRGLFTQLGEYDVVFWANDTSNNWNDSSLINFYINQVSSHGGPGLPDDITEPAVIIPEEDEDGAGWWNECCIGTVGMVFAPPSAAGWLWIKRKKRQMIEKLPDRVKVYLDRPGK